MNTESEIRKSEWQKWVPVLGLVRLIQDEINENGASLVGEEVKEKYVALLRKKIYSGKYQIAQIITNVVTTGAVAYKLTNYALDYFSK